MVAIRCSYLDNQCVELGWWIIEWKHFVNAITVWTCKHSDKSFSYSGRITFVNSFKGKSNLKSKTSKQCVIFNGQSWHLKLLCMSQIINRKHSHEWSGQKLVVVWDETIVPKRINFTATTSEFLVGYVYIYICHQNKYNLLIISGWLYSSTKCFNAYASRY